MRSRCLRQPERHSRQWRLGLALVLSIGLLAALLVAAGLAGAGASLDAPGAREIAKTKVVQMALRKHLSQANDDPFLALIGSGNGKFTTDDIMKLSRGDDWNQP
jgi:hypothetical protein